MYYKYLLFTYYSSIHSAYWIKKAVAKREITMTNKRTIFSIIPLILVIGMVVFPILGVSNTRQEYAVDFIKSTQNEVWGPFSEYNKYIDEEIETETTLSTLSAVVGLSMMDALDEVSTSSTQSWLTDRINWGIDYNGLSNLSEALEAIDLVNSTALSVWNRGDDYKDYVENHSLNVGDSLGYKLYVENNVSILGTYHAVRAFYFLDNLNETDVTNVTNFIVNSLDVDGGFKNSPTSNGSSLSATFYAIQTLSYLDTIDALNDHKTLISSYITQFYVDDPSLENSYGGFSISPEVEVPFATVRSTYESIVSLKALGLTIPDQEATINWLLQNQNLEDG